MNEEKIKKEGKWFSYKLFVNAIANRVTVCFSLLGKKFFVANNYRNE